jgi:hypothetical protein
MVAQRRNSQGHDLRGPKGGRKEHTARDAKKSVKKGRRKNKRLPKITAETREASIGGTNHARAGKAAVIFSPEETAVDTARAGTEYRIQDKLGEYLRTFQLGRRTC